MSNTAAPAGFNLGSSTFTLAIDDSSFTAKMIKAEETAKDTSRKIGSAFGHGSNASLGLLALGQAVDDAQYGFKAIVNNIPQVISLMGGGAGLAGAIGIAAVAVNQLVNHWEELKATISNSEPIMGALDAIKTKIEEMAGLPLPKIFDILTSPDPGVKKAMEELGFGEGAAAAGRMQARAKAEGDAAKAEMSKIGNSTDAERGKMFEEAVKAYGGGDKLIQEVTDRIMRANPLMNAADASRMAALKIQAGTKGVAFDPGAFGNTFEGKLGEIQDRKFREEQARIEIQGRKNIAEWDKKQEKKKIDELNQQGADIERQTRRDFEKDKQKRIDELQGKIDKKEDLEHMLRKAASSIEPAKIFGGGHEFANNMIKSGLDSTAKQQLKQAELVTEELRGLRRDMRNVHHMTFENP